MSAEEDIVERLRRRAARARDRYPDEADDPATLVGGLIQDYEAAADEIQRMRDASNPFGSANFLPKKSDN